MPPKKKRSGSSKSKERKLRRKQEQEEVAASLAKVNAAYAQEDLMDGLVPFRTFKRNSLDLSISFCRVSLMTPEDLKWTFDLMKECVKSYYMGSGWGWNDKEKWEELTHESACFLLVRDNDTNSLKAFVNFRFDLDEQVEVLYCYEIHLSPEVRRKGLGKFLIQILELIGHRVSMKKVVLTIFKANTISNSFFREKLNYIEDETSPLFCDPLHEEEYSYSILSKTLARKQQLAPQVARAAHQVRELEGGSVTAHKAVHEDMGRGNHRVTSAAMDGKSDKVALSQATKKMSEFVRVIEMVEQLKEERSEEGEGPVGRKEASENGDSHEMEVAEQKITETV